MTRTEHLIDTTGSSGMDRFAPLRSPTADEKSTPVPRTAKSANSYSGTGIGTGPVRFEPLTARIRSSDQLDQSLLERAAEVLDDIEKTNPEAMSLAIESLRFVVCELWTSATAASQYHQSLLALVESLLLSTEKITLNQAVALRGAIADLARPNLSEQHLEVTRSRFIDEGYNPLAPISSMEDEEDGTRPSQP